ncbi:MAG: hypothetical protein EKK55_03655 [Rhodocyclaceae bacterium]|nr:MAG: hypothetical protein EKK55_03655 [Rhodocyclaceae bacterium]
MPADSRFVYPRSIQNDVADTLASCRQMVPGSELWVIDLITKSLLDTFFEHDPAFHSRVDEWARRARYRYDTPRQQPLTNLNGDQHHG